MESDNFRYLIQGVGIGLVLGVLIHFAVSNCHKSSKLKEEAVELNYAEYNKGTGEWQWIERKK